ncbi:MAG: MarR family winged helix-turn-helix transcriptional regulator [Actinomycetota bacterium]|nr:MarR family winged helix-turn-helix transcriptional regulator [Actinomycetota bacterium]MDA8073601.1 MarR family winged helix-turn-helix transcriptional regulator [Actinomycetota bacterium]
MVEQVSRHSHVQRRGFDDVRPAHGFAFARISAGDATTADLAVHLGITKQAAAQLVNHLAERGYVERRPDPRDKRARLLMLTERGLACTVAAEQAAAETVEQWKDQLGPTAYGHLAEALGELAEPGRLRPGW